MAPRDLLTCKKKKLQKEKYIGGKGRRKKSLLIGLRIKRRRKDKACAELPKRE